MSNTNVAGVYTTDFVKPGAQRPFRVTAGEAITGALADAGLIANDIQQAFASYVYGDSTCGQHALYDAFMSGIPVFNVNNNCSSGSSAIYLARQAIESGAADCVLAFGFEEMQPGALASHWEDRESPFDLFNKTLDAFGYPDAPLALRTFGAAGHHYMQRYGVAPTLFADVAVKSRSHALHNSRSLFRSPLSRDEVMQSSLVYHGYLTRLMCCPPTCGAAAAILCSKAFAERKGLSSTVTILSQAMTTDTKESLDSPINLIGSEMTRRAAAAVYENAGVGPDEIDVVELHDCFTVNEVISYEALGLCPEGESQKFVAAGDNTYGGSVVVNPSGGLMSKGHPLGATGLAQCCELVTQLRGRSGARQVPQARTALQHNLGLGGAAVVTLYQS
ncbi:MAG TPA: lipid-transfer protein [Spongiibacteraceae bacterium]|nr:lipid-transfer protein [Spongiibacteraceae bacterium]HCS27648.1 lipid-transfer protein [Spongiibacteraceae bacterium]|tara:strand:+ start:5159 stop:6328 length:1170 start_codon:yes stop_codon:yes gene_type:complete